MCVFRFGYCFLSFFSFLVTFCSLIDFVWPFGIFVSVHFVLFFILLIHLAHGIKSGVGSSVQLFTKLNTFERYQSGFVSTTLFLFEFVLNVCNSCPFLLSFCSVLIYSMRFSAKIHTLNEYRIVYIVISCMYL